MTVTEAAELLGVRDGATREEIEDAFLRLARLSHPDRFAGATADESAAAAAEFIRISDARDLLLRAAAERAARAARVTAPLVYDVDPRPVRRPPGRSTVIWTSLLIVVSGLCFLGGSLPLSPWNLVLLVPLDCFAIVYARTGRRGALVGTLLFAAFNAVVAVALASFGSLVALELLLAPVIALVVIGRGHRLA
jgi:hypothetical protein